MPNEDGVIGDNEFQELTLRFFLASAAVRKAFALRLEAGMDEPVFDSASQDVNPRLRRTTALGSLHMDHLNAATESMVFLAERFMAAGRMLNTNATLIDVRMRELVTEMSHLKAYFGDKSGYDDEIRQEVRGKIDSFLDTAAGMGFVPEQSVSRKSQS